MMKTNNKLVKLIAKSSNFGLLIFIGVELFVLAYMSLWIWCC